MCINNVLYDILCIYKYVFHYRVLWDRHTTCFITAANAEVYVNKEWVNTNGRRSPSLTVMTRHH